MTPVGHKEIAELLGCGKSTIHNFVDAGMPKMAHGKYDPVACLKWWLKNIHEDSGDDESLKAAKQKYWRAKAEKETILARQMKAELVPLADVLSAWADRVSIVTSGLEMLTNRLPPLLVGRDRDDIQDTLAAEFRALREQYAARGEHCESTKE